MVHFEALQHAGNAAANRVNAQGDTVIERLGNISTQVEAVARQGVHLGAAHAIAAAEVHYGQDMRGLNEAMPDDEDVDDIVDDFEPAAEQVVALITPTDVISNALF